MVRAAVLWLTLGVAAGAAAQETTGADPTAPPAPRPTRAAKLKRPPRRPWILGDILDPRVPGRLCLARPARGTNGAAGTLAGLSQGARLLGAGAVAAPPRVGSLGAVQDGSLLGRLLANPWLQRGYLSHAELEGLVADDRGATWCRPPGR